MAQIFVACVGCVLYTQREILIDRLFIWILPSVCVTDCVGNLETSKWCNLGPSCSVTSQKNNIQLGNTCWKYNVTIHVTVLAWNRCTYLLSHCDIFSIYFQGCDNLNKTVSWIMTRGGWFRKFFYKFLEGYSRLCLKKNSFLPSEWTSASYWTFSVPREQRKECGKFTSSGNRSF